MKHILLVGVIVLLAVTVTVTLAQTGSGYDLTWSTIDGGGMMFSTGGGYGLGGTMGQPDAGVMNNGDYSLAGGFWGGAAAPYRVYLPVVLLPFRPQLNCGRNEFIQDS